MKNNPNTKYVLIGLVVLIWGFIIYKVVKGLSDDDIVLPVTALKPIAKPEADSTYHLLAADYQDPFGNDIVIDEATEEDPTTTPTATQPQPPPIPAPLPPQEPPPVIKYNGYIYNPARRKRTALITYNGQSMVVSTADKLDEKTRIIKIEEAQLVVSFKGKRIVINIGG